MPGPETCEPLRGGPVADADEARPAGDAPASFAALLAGCRSLFPRALMGDAGWERILDRARRLPRSVTDTPFGFEFHLGETRPEADLCVVALPGSDLSQHYVRQGERAGPGSAAAALAAGLREQIANPDSWLARCVEGLVLEYDLAGLPPHRPPAPPGVFLAPKKSADPKTLPAHRDPAGVLAALAATVGWDGHRESGIGEPAAGRRTNLRRLVEDFTGKGLNWGFPPRCFVIQSSFAWPRFDFPPEGRFMHSETRTMGGLREHLKAACELRERPAVKAEGGTQ